MTVSECSPVSSPTKAKTTTSKDYFQSFYSVERKKMLAHQRLPVHVEYLQPHITTTESKASPLALLAATCSSIGKTDAEKKEIKTTTTTPTILSKLSPSQESEKKSSFKPYKLDDKRSSPSSTMRSSPPVLVSNSNIVSTKASLPSSIGSPAKGSSNRAIDKISNGMLNAREFDEYSRYQDRLSRDMKCHSVSPPLPHLPPKVSMLPHHGPNHNHADCIQCKTGLRPPHPTPPHGDVLSSVRPSTAPPPHPCSCPMCHSGRNVPDGKCHFPPHPSIPGIYQPMHKGASLPPPVMQCRDPGCTNCTKLPTSKSLQNFVHPALVHQCAHNPPPHKSPYPPHPANHQAPYDSYFSKNGLSPHKPKPYVCNWVFEGKHCGNSFVTSEELYQHLRSHTSLQQQRNNENEALSRSTPNISPIPPPAHPPSAHGPITPPGVPGTCNIHGCPCSAGQRKTSPRPVIPGYSYGSSVSTGLRYSPYGRPVPAGGSGIPGHGFSSHSMYHY